MASGASPATLRLLADRQMAEGMKAMGYSTSVKTMKSVAGGAASMEWLCEAAAESEADADDESYELPRRRRFREWVASLLRAGRRGDPELAARCFDEAGSGFRASELFLCSSEAYTLCGGCHESLKNHFGAGRGYGAAAHSLALYLSHEISDRGGSQRRKSTASLTNASLTKAKENQKPLAKGRSEELGASNPVNNPGGDPAHQSRPFLLALEQLEFLAGKSAENYQLAGNLDSGTRMLDCIAVCLDEAIPRSCRVDFTGCSPGSSRTGSESLDARLRTATAIDVPFVSPSLSQSASPVDTILLSSPVQESRHQTADTEERRKLPTPKPEEKKKVQISEVSPTGLCSEQRYFCALMTVEGLLLRECLMMENAKYKNSEQDRYKLVECYKHLLSFFVSRGALLKGKNILDKLIEIYGMDTKNILQTAALSNCVLSKVLLSLFLNSAQENPEIPSAVITNSLSSKHSLSPDCREAKIINDLRDAVDEKDRQSIKHILASPIIGNLPNDFARLAQQMAARPDVFFFQTSP